MKVSLYLVLFFTILIVSVYTAPCEGHAPAQKVEAATKKPLTGKELEEYCKDHPECEECKKLAKKGKKHRKHHHKHHKKSAVKDSEKKEVKN
ncbi:unnamed protein product [Caenorhabditis angaria]|uniref:Uncharacterized protein n=1 Tax=Caenorhabditis angaria TaxID=860376 RepID=A0A9P1IJT4_9PELO|nr:unnamed protein product [Caenorhabditis angaria]